MSLVNWYKHKMLRINKRIFIVLLPSLKFFFLWKDTYICACLSSVDQKVSKIVLRTKKNSILMCCAIAKKKQAHFHVELKKVTFEVIIGFQCSQIDLLWRFLQLSRGVLLRVSHFFVNLLAQYWSPYWSIIVSNGSVEGFCEQFKADSVSILLVKSVKSQFSSMEALSEASQVLFSQINMHI